ncbi:cystatin-11 [Dasypus novemcinctus]|uniref:cystatin-11 n=1 Tax=Dasypus novemcinctus TaxID=9361 RepID=UPI0000E35CCC|nr:cystatin-11 [Dasypus novemcinctus]
MASGGAMARPQQAPRLLLAILVTLVAFSYEARKKSFIMVYEVSAVDTYAADTIEFTINKFNKESNDEYNFRVVRVLKLLKQVTDHMEFIMDLEMRRTKCLKKESHNCPFQEGNLYKQIRCSFTVFTIPWFEKYKILKKNCTDV